MNGHCQYFDISEGNAGLAIHLKVLVKTPESQIDNPKLLSFETKNARVPGSCSRNNLLHTDHLLSIFASHFSSSPYHPTERIRHGQGQKAK